MKRAHQNETNSSQDMTVTSSAKGLLKSGKCVTFEHVETNKDQEQTHFGFLTKLLLPRESLFSLSLGSVVGIY